MAVSETDLLAVAREGLSKEDCSGTTHHAGASDKAPPEPEQVCQGPDRWPGPSPWPPLLRGGGALPPQSPYTPQPSCQDMAVTWEMAQAEWLGSPCPTLRGPSLAAREPGAGGCHCRGFGSAQEEGSPAAAPCLTHHCPFSQGIKKRGHLPCGCGARRRLFCLCLCRGLRISAVQPTGLLRVVLKHLLRMQIPGPAQAP